MLEAIRDVFEETGRMVGMKPAGGIRHAKQAVQYLVQLHETLGVDWLTPDLYRLGASSLLNDVLMQLRKERTGATKARTTSPLTDRAGQGRAANPVPAGPGRARSGFQVYAQEPTQNRDKVVTRSRLPFVPLPGGGWVVGERIRASERAGGR